MCSSASICVFSSGAGTVAVAPVAAHVAAAEIARRHTAAHVARRHAAAHAEAERRGFLVLDVGRGGRAVLDPDDRIRAQSLARNHDILLKK